VCVDKKKHYYYLRLIDVRVTRKKDGTEKYIFMELSTPPRKTHEIDEMGLVGFLYDRGFPNGPVSAADTGPGGSHT
jgi:hypothetical protein